MIVVKKSFGCKCVLIVKYKIDGILGETQD